MRGIILAGGTGSRLHPITQGISKQLVPVYDKPMIYYPLSTLMLAGIRDILIITTPHEAERLPPAARRRLAVRHQPHLRRAAQPRRARAGLHHRRGPHRRRAGRRWCSATTSSTASGLGHQLLRFTDLDGAAVFGYHVADPTAYGVVEFDDQGRALSLEEKPRAPEERLRGAGALLLRQRRGRSTPPSSSRRRAASSRSPTSTASTSRRAASTSRCCRAAPPGSTPAPSTPSTTPPTSCARSRAGRASRSAPPRRSPGGWASSPTTSSSSAPSRCSRAGTASYLLGPAAARLSRPLAVAVPGRRRPSAPTISSKPTVGAQPSSLAGRGSRRRRARSASAGRKKRGVAGAPGAPSRRCRRAAKAAATKSRTRVADAGGDDVVAGLVGPGGADHRVDVVGRPAPVAAGVEVAEHELGRPGPAAIAATVEVILRVTKRSRPARRLVVVEDRARRVQAALAVDADRRGARRPSRRRTG